MKVCGKRKRLAFNGRLVVYLGMKSYKKAGDHYTIEGLGFLSRGIDR